TGDAVSVALTTFPDDDVDDAGDIVILPGDTPLLRPATLGALVRAHRRAAAAATVLTARLAEPTRYARIVRSGDGRVSRTAQLAVAERELRDRINKRWMRRGVTMLDPERTYVDVGVELAPDVTLFPGVVLQGRTVIATGAEIGPNTHLVDCAVGEGATVTTT